MSGIAVHDVNFQRVNKDIFIYIYIKKDGERVNLHIKHEVEGNPK